MHGSHYIICTIHSSSGLRGKAVNGALAGPLNDIIFNIKCKVVQVKNKQLLILIPPKTPGLISQ